MTLARLLLAWLPVTVLFVLAWPLDPRFASERPPRRPTRRGADVMLRAIEAAALTLFAALWFDSLGHGGWWLLFAIVGILVGVQRLSQGEPRTELRGRDPADALLARRGLSLQARPRRVGAGLAPRAGRDGSSDPRRRLHS